MIGFAVEHFTPDFMQKLVIDCLGLMLNCSIPMLAAAIIVGVLVAMFQSVTQVQEQTLSFVPKIVATFLALVLYGPEIYQNILTFAREVFKNIATMGPR